MIIMVILLYVFLHFHIIYNIFWTNLLIQCPVPVSVCFVCALQKKVKNKSGRKISEKIPKNIHGGRLQKPEGGPEGGTPWPGASIERPGGGGALWSPGSGGTPQAALCPLFSPCSKNPRGEPHYAISSTVLPPPWFWSGDRLKNLSRHPARGRIDLRRLLNHHDCLRDAPWIVPLGPWVHDQ